MSGKSIRARAPRSRSSAVRAVMLANTGGNSQPERILRSALHRLGLRFFKHKRPIASFRCAADVVFPRAKVCVFIDGCFWHGCPKHHSTPHSNSAWWREKIAANVTRDERQAKRLRKEGWVVVRVWEHDIGEKSLPAIALRILKAIERRTRPLAKEAR